MNLEDFWFFESLTEDEIKRVQQITLKREYKKGEILFYVQEQPKYLHFLAKGTVKLYKHDQKANEVVLHYLHGPNFIAELSNFDEVAYPANCSFESDAKVYLIDYSKFKEEFLCKYEISLLFIKSLTKKIKALESFINYSLTTDSYIKTARFLYENEELFKTMKQLKIASLLNITPETLSRNLARLKEEKIIAKINTHFEIIDHEKLQTLLM